ncbi:MAG: hypothetical protein ACMXX6_00155 [Candidatus Woesearchaeota archaeon]
MEIKKISENKSAMPRHEVIFAVKYTEKTPSRLDLKQALVKELKSKDELVFVKKIKNDYGKKELVATTYKYDNAEAMKSVEFEKQIAKNFPKEEKGEDNE